MNTNEPPLKRAAASPEPENRPGCRSEGVTKQACASSLNRDRTENMRRFRLRDTLVSPVRGARLFYRAYVACSRTIPARLCPGFVRRLVRGVRRALTKPEAAPPTTDAYVVQRPPAPPAGAPRIVHVIANFMTGGSSRLVIDLIEQLGSHYHQMILTSFIPTPPAYINIDIEECRFPRDTKAFSAYYKKHHVDFVHVHYWGDCDEPWYQKAIDAAHALGVPVIENINTPISPYRSPAVVKYIYVSDYVRRVFGEPGTQHITVYPGSNFRLYTRPTHDTVPEDCVGMVYRLERDKLNEDAIRPFIRIAQLRPRTRILIVGGGSLLQSFQDEVAAAHVEDNFEFTGYVKYEELPDLYRRMSLFIAPVWKESFGQVSPFAMSMMIPVIGYDVGAIGEILKAPELLAPAGDVDRLTQIAIDLLDAPERRRDIGAQQQRRAQDHFSVEAMIAHYGRVYSEMRTKRTGKLA